MKNKDVKKNSIIKKAWDWLQLQLSNHPYFTLSIFSLYMFYLYNNGHIFYAVLYFSFIIFMLAVLILFKRMDDEFERIWRMTIVAILTFTLTAYTASSFAKNIVPVEFYIGSIDAWIGFAGSILGGTITMLALVFTIDHENKLRKVENSARERELALQSIPTIVLQITNYGIQQSGGKLFSYTSRFYIDHNEDIYFVLPFQLRNLSKYVARELNFRKFRIFSGDGFVMGLNPEAKRLVKNIAQEINDNILNSEILPGEYSIPLDVEFEYKPVENELIEIEAELEFSDYLNVIKHNVQITVYISAEILDQIHIDEYGDQYRSIEFSISDIPHHFKN